MISTKGRYALRVMLDLASHAEDGYIPLRDIALRQDISKKYLETIVRTLVSARLLEGVSGKGGGYKLTRSPGEYPLGEILELMEGTLSPVACLAEGASPCGRESVCPTLPLWKEFHTLVHDFFYGKTLEDLLSSPSVPM